MKNIKKLLLTGFVPGFILGCAITNIFAMQDDEMKGLPKPDFTYMAETTQEGAPSATATTATAQTRSDAEIQAFEEAHGLDFLSALPDPALENFLARHIESDLANAKDQTDLLKKLEFVINKLTSLRLINKRFAKFLTYQEIIDILKEANIVIRANRINTMSGETLLHRAIRSGYIALARILIRSGVNINAPLEYPHDPTILQNFPVGSTSLHFAAKQRYVGIVLLLLQHGADITATTTSKYSHLNNLTPLDLARRENLQPIIEILEADCQAKGIDIPEKRRTFHANDMETEEGIHLPHAAPTAMELEAFDENFTLGAPAPAIHPYSPVDGDEVVSDDDYL